MIAACACGQLTAQASGDPLRAVVCHCHACRTRTGSAFSLNTRFASDAVTMQGTSKAFTRTGDEGSQITYHFCPDCGVTVWYLNDQIDGVMIPGGALAPADLPAPTLSVYDVRRPDWLRLAGMDVMD
ncbi:GFA family protein [Yoonia sp. R2331]|uniref:GFA family protein n=1 Tax=Yoonia sp. R2331 TaxID=3237238 RepID=UPI0034E5BE68